MSSLLDRIVKDTDLFARDENGATALEYGLIVALVAVAIIGGLTALGTSNGGSWAGTAQKAADAMN